jgi:hypothetical protein
MRSRMFSARATAGLMLVTGTACGDRPASTALAAATTKEQGECAILSAADIASLTGVEVRSVAPHAVVGAGGNCGNYATADSQLYLGVNRLSSVSEFELAVRSVPTDVYPVREPITGLGDEAILFKEPQMSLRYLVARAGSHGVVLFHAGTSPSDQQLGQLAALALTR